MKLKDMKQSADELQPEAKTPEQGPRYAYGLQLDLNDATLKKLGLTEALPAVGTVLTLEAKAVVRRVSASDDAEASPSKSVGLQITHLALDTDDDEEGDKPGAAEVLYGKPKPKA